MTVKLTWKDGTISIWHDVQTTSEFIRQWPLKYSQLISAEIL